MLSRPSTTHLLQTLVNLKLTLSVAFGNAQERAKNKGRLRQRLESVKSQVSAETNFLMTNMDPREFIGPPIGPVHRFPVLFFSDIYAIPKPDPIG